MVTEQSVRGGWNGIATGLKVMGTTSWTNLAMEDHCHLGHIIKFVVENTNSSSRSL